MHLFTSIAHPIISQVNSVQTSYADGSAILKRKSMMRTQRFEEILPSELPTLGNVGHIDLLASYTHQQALLGATTPMMGDSPEVEQASDPAPFHDPGSSASPHINSLAGTSPPVLWNVIKSAIEEHPGKGGRLHQDGGQVPQGQAQSSSSYAKRRLQTLKTAQRAFRTRQQRATDDPAQHAASKAPIAQRLLAQSILNRNEQDTSSEENSPTFSEKPPTVNPSVPYEPLQATPSDEPLQATPAERLEEAGPARKSSKQKRKNSRVKTQRVRLGLDKAKSHHFPPDQREGSPDECKAVSPFQLPGVITGDKDGGQSPNRFPGHMSVGLVMQRLSGRPSARVQPQLPNLDIFTVNQTSPKKL